MQGELREIDIRSILQLIEVGQRSGELLVEAYASPTSKAHNGGGSNTSDGPKRPVAKTLSWFVFFHHGQIVYAADSNGSVRRLQDYLRRYDITEADLKASIEDNTLTPHSLQSLPYSTPEYSYLWALLAHGVLTPPQARSIVRGMIRETLFDLLSLHQGSFIFEMSSPLSPTLITVKGSALVGHIMQRIQHWKQLHPYIQSPDQCPCIDDHQPLQQSLKPSSYRVLTEWAQGNISIRQIGRYLNRDVVSVAKALYPYIIQGIVHLSETPACHPNPPSLSNSPPPIPRHLSDYVPKVVCLDDGITFRESVKSTLGKHGYEVYPLGNPLDALGQVFLIKPDLILCDIAMPELDGYEVCAMLRKSTFFRQTPIVMLTGKDGFIDRIKARMVGANDYLTKPFSGLELITIVERYVGSGLGIEGSPKGSKASQLAHLISTD